MNALKRIRELMDERQWTEYQLAKKSGLSRSTVSNMFKRNNMPTFSTLESICDAFNMTVTRFFMDMEGEELLTPEETQLLSRWDRLSTEQKEALLHLMDTM